MRKVIGIGETVLDIIFKDNQPQKAVPGGSVFNCLTSLGRLDVPVQFVSELGDDSVGDIIRAFMQENKIDASYVERFSSTKSPISLAFLNDKNDASYTFYKDSPKQRIGSPLPSIAEDDLFIYGSYYALNPLIRSRMTDFLSYAKQHNAILYYDPNFRLSHANEAIKLHNSFIENFEFADIVRGSDEDFANIYREENIERMYRNNIRYYCPYLIVTHAGKGVHLYTPTFQKHIEVSPIQTISTIGAGDNFNAGMLYGLIKHGVKKADLPNLSLDVWEDIIRCGIAFASEVCQSYDNYISTSFAQSYRKS